MMQLDKPVRTANREPITEEDVAMLRYTTAPASEVALPWEGEYELDVAVLTELLTL